MINNAISAIILAMFFYGISLRLKNEKLHAKWMFVVMGLDLSLVAYLAFFREVLTKINGGMPALLVVHLFFALSTVLLYFVVAYSGIKLQKGAESFRPKMKRFGRLLIVARVSTLITSLALATF